MQAARTGKKRQFLVGAILAGAIGISTIASPTANAQGRDQALDAVRALTAQLIERTESGSAHDDRIWAGVQALTDALRRFILAETEIRAEEKVGLPPIASLRPGQEEITASAVAGSEDADLADVPTPWFNAQATKAQSAMENVRSGVEEGVAPEDLASRLRDVLNALKIVDHPPV